MSVNVSGWYPTFVPKCLPCRKIVDKTPDLRGPCDATIVRIEYNPKATHQQRAICAKGHDMPLSQSQVYWESPTF